MGEWGCIPHGADEGCTIKEFASAARLARLKGFLTPWLVVLFALVLKTSEHIDAFWMKCWTWQVYRCFLDEVLDMAVGGARDSIMF